MTVLFVVRNIAFIIFFSLIGTWYLSFVPIFVTLLAFMYSQDMSYDNALTTQHVKHFFLRHAFAFAWTCVMLGCRGVATIFGSTAWLVSLWLVGINIVLWLLSYVREYDDGKEMFHMGYRIASFIALGSAFGIVGATAGFLELIMGWIALSTALYGFIVFVGTAVGKKIAHTMTYPLFILLTLCLMFLVYRWTAGDVIVSLVLSQVLLMAIYCLIFGVYWYADELEQAPLEENTDELRRILAGTHRVKRKSHIPISQDVIRDAYTFLERLDDPTKFIISLFNIVLILGQVYMFLTTSGGTDIVLQEIFLWFGIIAFFVNYLLLREIGFYHSIQRVLAFILINFGIYLSIINIFGADPVYLVGAGTVWSIVNSVLMFHTGWLERKGILQSRDYTYRIGSNLLVTACNIYFVFLLPLSLQLRFFLALVYFGIQLFLTLYNVRYMQGK